MATRKVATKEETTKLVRLF